jgi:hypothetical protein
MPSWKLLMTAAALAVTSGCKTGTTDSGVNSTPNPPATATGGSSGGTTSGSGGGGSGPSIPTLVNVNLQNVLNDLSVSLQVNRNTIPVTAQVPIDVAAAVCGVSVDALAASIANGHGTCTATTTTPQLNQIVQQQISTGGDVNGGDQTLNTGSGGG